MHAIAPERTAARTRTKPSQSATRRGRVQAVVLAIASAVAIWLIAVAAGADVQSPAFDESPSADIGLGLVIGVSATAALGGWALLAILERVTRRSRRAWSATAVVVLLLSLSGPLSGAGISVANRLILVSMHVAAGAVLIGLLPDGGVPSWKRSPAQS